MSRASERGRVEPRDRSPMGASRSSVARMQRWVTTLVGIGVVVLAVWIVSRNFRAPRPLGHDSGYPTRTSAGADDGGGLMYALGDGGGPGSGGDAGGALFLSDLVDPGARVDSGSGTGTVLPDGFPVPPLPPGAPRQVRFGVVLVSYVGAQAPAGAHTTSVRSREDARALADRLVSTAQEDFHAAVQQGDPGSTDDLGQVKTGILEPAPEYVLFTLKRDAIGGPVDTPRGYWIVKRLE